MPENKNSFIKSKMNKDLDERLLPSNEYRDASNVAVSRSEGSDVGALESILGNTSVLTAVANSKIIGYFVDETNNFIYYFLTDLDGNLSERATASNTCTINRFDINTNNNIVLVSGYFLNFSKQYHMYGVSLMENLLFWTDNRNQPRKINIDLALGDSGYYTNEDQISVCKFAPYDAADFVNLRSPLAIKPSTMTNAQVASAVTIGGNEWISENLNVTTYSNGDPITEAQSAADWAAANAAGTGAWCQFPGGTGISPYGKLYNKYAVIDSRGLAPAGYTVATAANFDAIISSVTNEGTKLKTLKPWTPNSTGSTNELGFNGVPTGWRDITQSAGSQFVNQFDLSSFWNATNNDLYQLTTNAGLGTVTALNKVTASGANQEYYGRSVRVVKDPTYQGWSGDPEFLTDRFVKFSYRFKYDDNEYSVVAPFSQDVFIPQQNGLFESGDEDATFRTTVVEFMQNHVNNAVLNIALPSKDIITDYKITEIDIIFKQSDGLAYQVLETIDVNSQFISELNNTNIFQYSYESTIPYKTLPQSETTRVYDKVPIRALAQESSANRVIYGNFIQSNSAPLGLNYYINTTEKSTQEYAEYQNHSIKQNRNYQVGIILADKYGRQTDVVLSNYDGVLNPSGQPQPGSNYFNEYKNTSFTSSVENWRGDNLQLEFNNVIPESENANGVSGFPGSYAKGNYYLTTAALNTPYFNNNSTEEITATAAQTVFDFNDLLYADAVNADNKLNVYVNASNGWVLKTITTDYAIANNSNKLRVTFGSGLTATNIAKAEILFEDADENATEYKFTISNMFADFTTTFANIFGTTAQGKYLRGLYTDYTQITSVSALIGSAPNQYIEIKTKKQIAKNYYESTGTPRTNATYDIDPNGFYTYRVAIKQQQQEYYNVYLPGIIDGYPIVDDTKERGETAFITLVSDNINKVPRDLQEVGPLDDQFNSDTRMWGRVTNIADDNQQYFPNTNADKVQLIGTLTDVFPGVDVSDTDPPTTKEINQFSIFDVESKPNVAKIGTQAAIGLTEDLYEAPVGSTNYPADMKLAVYETEPVLSALELYWESSTAELVSDLNYNIQNNTTEITGSTIEAVAFPESLASGQPITNTFQPTDKTGLVTGADATLISVYSKYNDGILNTSNNRSSEFTLVDNGNTFVINTASTFYAGEDNATENYFQFTIQFKQSNNTLVNQSFNTTLSNVAPIIAANIAPSAPVAGTDKLIFDSITGGAGPTGTNGSADTCSRFLFPRQTGAGFELSTVTQLNGPGTTSSTTPAYVQSPSKTLVISAANTNIKVGMVVSNNTNTITQGTKVTNVAGTSITLDTTTGGTGALDVPANDTITFSESLTPADYFIIKKQEPKNVSNPCTPSSAAGVNEYGMQVLSAPGYTLVAGQSFQLTFTLKDALGLSTNVNGTISFTVAA